MYSVRRSFDLILHKICSWFTLMSDDFQCGWSTSVQVWIISGACILFSWHIIYVYIFMWYLGYNTSQTYIYIYAFSHSKQLGYIKLPIKHFKIPLRYHSYTITFQFASSFSNPSTKKNCVCVLCSVCYPSYHEATASYIYICQGLMVLLKWKKVRAKRRVLFKTH